MSEGGSQATLVAVTGAVGAYIAGTIDASTLVAGIAVGLVNVLYPEGLPVLQALLRALGRLPPAAGAVFIAVILGGGVLAACDQATLDRVAAVLRVSCQIDQALQPIIVPISAAAFPELAGAATVDEQLVHPAVVAACATLGGTPVAVTR